MDREVMGTKNVTNRPPITFTGLFIPAGLFEVDAGHIVTAVLWGLFLQGEVKADAINDAIRRYGIDADLPDPRDV